MTPTLSNQKIHIEHYLDGNVRCHLGTLQKRVFHYSMPYAIRLDKWEDVYSIIHLSPPPIVTGSAYTFVYIIHICKIYHQQLRLLYACNFSNLHS